MSAEHLIEQRGTEMEAIVTMCGIYTAFWAVCLGIGSMHSLFKFGSHRSPGPWQLVGMLWRGEIYDKRVSQ